MSLIPYAGHPALQASNGADPGEMPESLRRPKPTPEQKAALAAKVETEPKMPKPTGKLPVPPPSAKQDRAKAKEKPKSVPHPLNQSPSWPKPKSAPKAKPPGQRKPTVAKKAAKAAKAPRKAKAAVRASKANGEGPRPGTKTALVGDMLRRPEGCTAAEVLAATGWPAVSMPQQAKAVGVKLRKEKDGKVSRYWAA